MNTKRKKRYGKAIGARSAHKLLREIGGAPDHALAEAWTRVLRAPLTSPNEAIVRLLDGRVIWMSYGSASIFASENEVRDFLSFIEQQGSRKAEHPLGAQFSTGEDFVLAVPRLAEELASKAGLRAEHLDGSLESLEFVDRAARRLGGDAWLQDPTILAPVVAYVGEVMRKATRGRWGIRPGGSPLLGESWQPIIVGADGREHTTFWIFKELLERGAIRAVAQYEIATARL